MRLVIVTGMSGAGKTLALKTMEDFGYYCVDNLPPMLIPTFMDLCDDKKLDKWSQRIAIGIDVRGGEFFDSIYEALIQLKSRVRYEILFLDANDEVLVKRYKESRRSHPMAARGRVKLLDEISAERGLMQSLRDSAHHRIDTSSLSTRRFREIMAELFMPDYDSNKFKISIMSFGFKWGIPLDADLVFDVRFINNPFYIDRLRTHTGKDKDVIDYIMSFPETLTFLNKLEDMITFLIPEYLKEGKANLVVAIGCTGGMHRSVAIADALGQRLAASGKYNAVVDHRDIEQENRRYRPD